YRRRTTGAPPDRVIRFSRSRGCDVVHFFTRELSAISIAWRLLCRNHKALKGGVMESILQALKTAYASTSSIVVAGAPKIAATAIIIVVGVLLARIVRATLLRALGFVRFDAFANRIGVADMLRRAE